MKIVPIAFVAALLCTCCAVASPNDRAGEVVHSNYVPDLSSTEDCSTTLSSQTSYIAPLAIKPIRQGNDKDRHGLAINGRTGPVPAAIVSLGTSALLKTVVTSGQTVVIESNVPFTSTISPDITVTAVSTVVISTAIATIQIATTTSLSVFIPAALSDTVPSTTFSTFTFAFPTSSTSVALVSSHLSTPTAPSSMPSRPSSTVNSAMSNSPTSTISSSTGSAKLSQPSSLEDSSLSTNSASMTLAITSPSASTETSQSLTGTSTTGDLVASSIVYTASTSSVTKSVASGFPPLSSTDTKTSTLLTTATMYSTTLTTTRTTSMPVSSSTISTTDAAIAATISVATPSTSFISVSPLPSSTASSILSSLPISTSIVPASLRTTTTVINEPNTLTSAFMSSGLATVHGPTSTDSMSENSISSAPVFTVTITETQGVCGSESTTQTAIATSTAVDSTISNEYSTSNTVIPSMTYNSTMPISYDTPASSGLAYATTGTSAIPAIPRMESQSPSGVSSIDPTGTQTPLTYTGAASHEASQVGKFAFWIGFVALAFLH